MSGLHFVCEGAILGKALRDVRNVVERANTIPIVGNVLIEAGEGVVRLTGTNFDIRATREIAAEITAAGSITVPAHRFADMVTAMPSGSQVEVKLAGSQLQLRGGRATFKLPTLDAEAFPPLPFGESVASITMPAATVRGAIDTVRYAMAPDIARFWLNGIFVHTDDPAQLKVAASDGDRVLARCALPMPLGGEAVPPFIISAGLVDLLRRTLGDADTDVEIDFSPECVRFASDGLTIIGKAIDGSFPDYQRIIPAGNGTLIKIDRDALRDAVTRVLLAGDDKASGVRLEVEKDRLTISRGDAACEGREEVPCETALPDGPRQYGFNGRCLKDSIDALDVDALEVALGDPALPALITSTARPDASLVLMPMRI